MFEIKTLLPIVPDDRSRVKILDFKKKIENSDRLWISRHDIHFVKKKKKKKMTKSKMTIKMVSYNFITIFGKTESFKRNQMIHQSKD